MPYDPIVEGAKCTDCILSYRREGGPVQPEMCGDVLIVGEAPGKDECQVNRPFVGLSGEELQRAIQIHGFRRADFSITNTLLCLHPNTMVWTEEGKGTRVADLVLRKYAGRVWCINAAGALTLASVRGWHKSLLANRRLFKLTSTHALRGPHGPSGPVLTEDHPVKTRDRGWVAVSELVDGEPIATADRRLEIESCVVGALLGDAGLHSNRFNIAQTSANADYVACKMRALSELGGSLTHVHTDKMRALHINEQTRLSFNASRWFRELSIRFYPNDGPKIVPRDIILDDVALAVWFLDDGDLRLRDNRMQRSSFATCGFSQDDVEWLAAQLRAFGMEDAHATWNKHWKGADLEKKGYWRIALGPIGTERLAVRIAKFVPESMQYKLPVFHRGKFDPEAWAPVATKPYFDASEVRPFEGPIPNHVYCLDVEEMHNFVVGGGFVVHNCRPPGNELAKLTYAWRAENNRRKKLNRNLGEDEEKYVLLPHPIECCRPRLFREVAKFSKVIVLGDTAYKTVTSSNENVTSMRGSPHEGWFSPTDGFVECDTSSESARCASELMRPEGARPVQIVPTFHPAYVLRKRMWTHVFRADLGRAMRWFSGRLGWTDPEYITRPSPAALRRFLQRPERFFAYDLETDAKEPLVAKIRLFGVGTSRMVMVVPFLSTDGHTLFYTESDLAEIKAIFREWLTSRRSAKFGWNGITYDAAVILQQLGCGVSRHIDGILMHHDVESELPHKLGFVGTELTDVPAWKQKSEDPLNCDDPTLQYRNSRDVAVTAALLEPLERELALRDQVDVCKKDHKIQQICAGMHHVGMLIDPVARNEHDKRLLAQIVKYRKICRDVVGDDKFNPNSVPQIAELLFDKWGLPPVELSEKTGAPSTGDDALRTYRVEYNLTSDQRRFIEALRKVRLAVKLRGTNIVKFRRRTEKLPYDPWAEDSEETEAERTYRKKKDVEKYGILLDDGRVHSSFTTHIPVTGRLASNSPNLQNVKINLRNMFVAPPGHVLVGADADQLELRYAAGRWHMQKMLEILRDGRDPHHETALACFGHAAEEQYALAVAWAKITKKPDGRPYKPKEFPAYGRVRDFSKRLRYAVQYGAEDKTVHRVISSTEDDHGNLIYADVSLTDTSTRRRRLLDADPEYEQGWAEEVALWRKNGYLREKIWGRRRDFLNGEEFNEIVNFEIQSGCAALINEATFDLVDAIPFEKWGPGTGLINQCHDALVVQCPESEGKRVAQIMTECMTRTYPGLDVQFKAEAKIGRTWLDVK